MVGSTLHFAYRVKSSVTFVSKSYAVVHSGSVNQPSKVRPARVGAAGFDRVPFRTTLTLAISLPPCVSKVTV